MKLRVRFGSGRRVAVVDVPGDEPIVQDAVEAAEKALAKLGYEGGSNFDLSLDGRSVLNRNETLRQVGIVTGDLVRVVSRAPIKVKCVLDKSWKRPPDDCGIPQQLRDYLVQTKFESKAEPFVALFNYWMLQLGFEAKLERKRKRSSSGNGTKLAKTTSGKRNSAGSAEKEAVKVERYPFREPQNPLPPSGKVGAWRKGSGTFVLVYKHVLMPENDTEVLVSAMLPNLIVQGVTDAGKFATPFDLLVNTKSYSAMDFSFIACLEVLFKDRIAVPLLAVNQSAAGVTPTSLMGMPDELIEKIMTYCSATTRGSLAAVNERFWDLDARLRSRKGAVGKQTSANVKNEMLVNLFL